MFPYIRSAIALPFSALCHLFLPGKPLLPSRKQERAVPESQRKKLSKIKKPANYRPRIAENSAQQIGNFENGGK